MALAALNCTLTDLGSGQYRGAAVPGPLPAADLTDVNAAIATALANASGTTDSTTDIEAIQTAVDALALALSTPVVVLIDRAALTKKNQFDAAIPAARAAAIDAGFLT